MVNPVERFNSIYEPNSFGGPVENPDFSEPPLKISGDADRYIHREGNDDYGQPRALFSLFDDGQKARLFANIAEAIQGVPDEIAERQLGHFEKLLPDYAAGVRKALADLAKVLQFVMCKIALSYPSIILVLLGVLPNWKHRDSKKL